MVGGAGAEYGADDEDVDALHLGRVGPVAGGLRESLRGHSFSSVLPALERPGHPPGALQHPERYPGVLLVL